MSTIRKKLEHAHNMVTSHEPASHSNAGEGIVSEAFQENSLLKSQAYSYARSCAFLIDNIATALNNPLRYRTLDGAIAKAEHVIKRSTPFCDHNLLLEVSDLIKNDTDATDKNLREKTHALLDPLEPLDDDVLTQRIKEMQQRHQTNLDREKQAQSSEFNKLDLIGNYYGFYSETPNLKLKSTIDFHHNAFKEVMTDIIQEIKTNPATSPSSGTGHHPSGKNAQFRPHHGHK